jgi:hypothetical protein
MSLTLARLCGEWRLVSKAQNNAFWIFYGIGKIATKEMKKLVNGN